MDQDPLRTSQCANAMVYGRWGISYPQLYFVLLFVKLIKSMPQPYKVTLEMANDFLEMKKQGFTLKEIGAKHNVAPRNVDYWLKKFREVGYNVPSPRVIIPPPTNEQKN